MVTVVIPVALTGQKLFGPLLRRDFHRQSIHLASTIPGSLLELAGDYSTPSTHIFN